MLNVQPVLGRQPMLYFTWHLLIGVCIYFTTKLFLLCPIHSLIKIYYYNVRLPNLFFKVTKQLILLTIPPKFYTVLSPIHSPQKISHVLYIYIYTDKEIAGSECESYLPFFLFKRSFKICFFSPLRKSFLSFLTYHC